MNWRFVKAFPKYALVLIVLLGSTVAFGLWWFLHSAKNAFYGGRPVPVEDIGPKLALIEAKYDRLILIDNDLYEIDSGTVIFKNWLKVPMPLELFYESKSKKFIGHYERGFVRFGLNGVVEGDLGGKFKPAFSDDLKWMVFAKGKDIWRADIDWAAFKPVNERKVTAIEQFHEASFAENIMLGTEKTLVVRNMMKLLRVNLETGDVKPVRLNINGIRKHRSPDGKRLVGLEKGQFYCYDVDSDDAKTIPVGRGIMNDYQWLGNDRCVAIAGGTKVVHYDRLKHTLTEVTALPFPCVKIGEPSPDNRFVFCAGRGTGALVDLEKKTATPVAGGSGMCWVSNNTYAFSRELPDSDLRGTWLQTVGEGERRISTEPLLVNKTGAELMTLKSLGVVIFSTKHGLFKMKPDGTELEKFGKLDHPPVRALGIQQWKAE